MVELFEWTWPDVARECEEWLAPKGFTAVQISPANDHVAQLEWWARYKLVTFELISRSGDEKAFIDMVQRCNKVGVGIYVDVVFNHITDGHGLSIAGHVYGNRSTPIFSQSDLHHEKHDVSRNCKVTDYRSKFNVQECDLWGLPDICTGCSHVQERVSTYLTKLVDIGVAGFRVDASKHINVQDLKQIMQMTAKGKSIFWFQEVFASAYEAVTPSQYTGTGALEYFEYAHKVSPSFATDGKLGQLKNLGPNQGLESSGSAVVFLDNHDTQRGEAPLTYRHGKLYELATLFMLAHPYGYPKVMSSYYFHGHDQGRPMGPVHEEGRLACAADPTAVRQPSPNHPWVCEHRWPAVASMAAWRRAAGDAEVSEWWLPEGNRLLFCRGNAACLILNRHETKPWDVTHQLRLPNGIYCDVIRSDNTTSCPVVHIAANGESKVRVPPMSAVAVHVGKMAADQELVV